MTVLSNIFLENLRRAADSDPKLFCDILLDAQRNVPSVRLLLNDAVTALPEATMPKVGDADRGIYLGTWEAATGHRVHAYAADDFLRNAKGNQLVLTFNEAQKELTRRNSGWAAGIGTEAALRAEIAKGGTDFEGKLVLPPLDLLNGRDVRGNTIRPGENICALLNDNKAPKIAEELERAEADKWAVCSLASSANFAYHARLTDSYTESVSQYVGRSGVIPVRLFRNGQQNVQPMPI